MTPRRTSPTPWMGRPFLTWILGLGLLGAVATGCERGPELPGSEILEGMETGTPRPEVLVALPVGPGVGEAGRLVVGYERDRYRIDGSGVEVLWVRRGSEGPLTALDPADVNPVIFRDDHLDGWGWSHFRARSEAWGLRDRTQLEEVAPPQWPEEERQPPTAPPADTTAGAPAGDGRAAADGDEGDGSPAS
jgi:hypothetical protein